jgi:putative ABC transport system ATP-binding protein
MTTLAAARPLPRPAGQPLIELSDVSVRYQSAGPAALRAVDLVVGHGELVTLTGATRSGKSTLLSVIGLLLRPTAGRYLLNGFDTGALRDRERTALRGRQIGCVLQQPRLLPARSALDNVLLAVLYAGLPRQRQERAAVDALDRVGLASRRNVLTGQLSAAEQQRVAVARAVAGDPSLLLCDDPTAGLDEDMSAQIIGLLVGLHREGRTVLIVTRDQLAAAYSSRSLTMSGVSQATGQGAGQGADR